MSIPQLYDSIGKSYAQYRRPDPRIAAQIAAALGNAKHIVNVGAGTGSYEPTDRDVIAVEPSETMIMQRSAGMAPVVRASAMNLPFRSDTFDAALALLTVHHWTDQRRGFMEMARVARRSVIFTWDNAFASDMWLMRDYFPEITELGMLVCPPVESYGSVFDRIEVVTVPIPHDCTDGFLQAYWRRPDAYFDSGVRSGISVFAQLRGIESGLARLRRDLNDGSWARRNHEILERNELDLGYRLVIGERR